MYSSFSVKGISEISFFNFSDLQLLLPENLYPSSEGQLYARQPESQGDFQANLNVLRLTDGIL
jgi:hypothetical protein